MTDEQKADLAVLANYIKDVRRFNRAGEADALRRIHDAISERFLDPAAEALEPLAKLSADAEWDDVPDNARADVVYRSEAGGEESVGTISFGDFRRARTALSAHLADAVQPAAGEGGLHSAAVAVIEAARNMPRRTPAAGGTGTIHMMPIEAGAMWTLDRALLEFDRVQAAALSTSVPAGVVEEARKNERALIADQLEAEADSLECTEDALVTIGNAALVRAGFSYEEVEARESRLDVAERELAEIRSMLLASQGDDDGPQIMPPLDDAMSTASMVAKCIALLKEAE